jgi:hypothetical protein
MLLSKAKRGAILLSCDRPVQRRMLIRSVTRPVLVHQVQVRVPGDLPCDKCHHALGTRNIIGQYQVADKETAPSQPVVVHFQVSDLTVHFLYRHLI